MPCVSARKMGLELTIMKHSQPVQKICQALYTGAVYAIHISQLHTIPATKSFPHIYLSVKEGRHLVKTAEIGRAHV